MNTNILIDEQIDTNIQYETSILEAILNDNTDQPILTTPEEKSKYVLEEMVVFDLIKKTAAKECIEELYHEIKYNDLPVDSIGSETSKIIAELHKIVNVKSNVINQNFDKILNSFTPPTEDDVRELWLKRDKIKKETPPEFIFRVYKKWLGKGLLQSHIKAVDKSLYMALHKWLKNNEFPTWLNLPSKNKKRKGEEITKTDYDIYRKVAAYISRSKRTSQK